MATRREIKERALRSRRVAWLLLAAVLLMLLGLSGVSSTERIDPGPRSMRRASSLWYPLPVATPGSLAVHSLTVFDLIRDPRRQ
jgi:hypothetical protein